MSFLSSLDNFALRDAYVIFHKAVDSFEIEHKHRPTNFWLGVQYPLKVHLKRE